MAMTLDELIEKLEAMRAAHGGTVAVKVTGCETADSPEAEAVLSVHTADWVANDGPTVVYLDITG
jgi:hypothetical protein